MTSKAEGIACMIRRIIRQPMDDLLACMEPLFRVRNPLPVFIPMLVALVVTWVLYVPIHELAHAYGCLWTGGDVSELQISARYGGAFYAKHFDFIVTHSDYAGRLSGFDTHGSDWVYLATVFLPFAISVVIGVPLLKALRGRRRPMLFGVAIVLGLAPFYNLTGDYLEMGSIIVTRVATGSLSGPAAFAGIRSDDVFKLITDIATKPGELGLDTPWAVVIGCVLSVISQALALVLAFLTYWAGHLFSRLLGIRGRTASAAPPQPAHGTARTEPAEKR